VLAAITGKRQRNDRHPQGQNRQSYMPVVHRSP
jgi:hypothetical protein